MVYLTKIKWKVATVCFTCCLFFCVGQATLQSDENGANTFAEGWRRTAKGWEHINQWQMPPRIEPYVQTWPHPLQVLIFQVVASCLAMHFCVFPEKKS